MKISEYTLLEDAFEAAFPFMLNRMEEILDTTIKRDNLTHASERCFSEFIIALEEIGVVLQDIQATRNHDQF
jgi:hypothetical protein